LATAARLRLAKGSTFPGFGTAPVVRLNERATLVFVFVLVLERIVSKCHAAGHDQVFRRYAQVGPIGFGQLKRSDSNVSQALELL
jgi:hypothetical protein